MYNEFLILTLLFTHYYQGSMETLQEERNIFSFIPKVEVSSFDKGSLCMLKFNRPLWSIGSGRLERNKLMEKKYEKLENLELKKKERILKAAFKEFANHGYENASTNRIVKAAGIGKGMLFYYFNNKKDLYLYLLNTALDIVTNEFLLHIEEEIPDLLDRLSHIARLKWDYFRNYPEVNQFLGTVMLSERDALPEEIQDKYLQVWKLGNERVYRYKEEPQNDFREDLDSDKAYQLIEWAVKGYQEENLQRFTGSKLNDLNLTRMWKEFDEYLDTLRKAFYKQPN